MIELVRIRRETPEWAQEALLLAGGFNIFGEANWRIVWGQNRLSWIGGNWEDRDPEGNLIRERFEMREIPKYPQRNRWHLERWIPPVKYGSPEQWYEQTKVSNPNMPYWTIPGLGPYPLRGEYESFFVIENRNQEFRKLDEGVVRFLCDEIIIPYKQMSFNEKQQNRQRAREEEEKQTDKRMDLVLSDSIPFGGRSTNTSSAGMDWLDIIRKDRESRRRNEQHIQ